MFKHCSFAVACPIPADGTFVACHGYNPSVLVVVRYFDVEAVRIVVIMNCRSACRLLVSSASYAEVRVGVRYYCYDDVTGLPVSDVIVGIPEVTVGRGFPGSGGSFS